MTGHVEDMTAAKRCPGRLEEAQAGRWMWQGLNLGDELRGRGQIEMVSPELYPVTPGSTCGDWL